MTRVQKAARDLGLDLNQDALDALDDLPPADWKSLLDQVASKADSIRNPSAYVIRTIDHGFVPGKGSGGGDPSAKGGKGGGKRSHSAGGGGGGGMRKSAARAAELGIDLDDTALDALSGVPLNEALQLLDDISAKGTGKGGIRNPSGYVASACAKINAAAMGGRDEGPAPLALAPPSFAPGGKGCGGKGGGGKGGKSAARAAELGIDLDESALEALANVPLTEALHLVEDVASKGVGKGGIRNPSGYIASACAKINDAAAWAAEAVGKAKGGSAGKGAAPPRPLVPPVGSGGSGPGGRSAARAAELGIELSDPALDALATIPLRDAYELLESLAGKGPGGGKGGIRNPSGWVVSAVHKMGAAEQPPPSASKGDNGRGSKGGGAGKGQGSIEDRIMGLNRSGLWNGEKIDVEALMALKRVPTWQAHELLDACEAKGAGKGGIKNPSNYIGAAVARIGSGGGGGAAAAPLEAPRKRPRQEYEARGGAGHGPVAQKARELRLDLDLEALDRLAAQPIGDAMELLEQVSANFDKIKNPSKYISAACDRGIEKDGSGGGGGGRPPPKRPRPSSVE
mmetsp:Transcript_22113/g.55334  ORF Transcript_22113/g.55334 Transcript_22113/m.55334 type:complete len:570 (-) Transcript_22113:61-1770(-)